MVGKIGVNRLRHRHTILNLMGWRNGTDRKNVLSKKKKKEVFLQRLFLSYRTIRHAGR